MRHRSVHTSPDNISSNRPARVHRRRAEPHVCHGFDSTRRPDAFRSYSSRRGNCANISHSLYISNHLFDIASPVIDDLVGKRDAFNMHRRGNAFCPRKVIRFIFTFFTYLPVEHVYTYSRGRTVKNSCRYIFSYTESRILCKPKPKPKRNPRNGDVDSG